MRAEPYLLFNGRCEEALAFYENAIGAATMMVTHFDQSPEPPRQPLPPQWGHKIMHAVLKIGDTLVMVSDGVGGADPVFAGFALSITADDEDRAKRVFDALADGGNVGLALGRSVWSPLFGMVTDRFGVTWMVSAEPRESAAREVDQRSQA